MKLEEVYKYFGGWYGIYKRVGFAVNTVKNWRRLGYIPVASQFKIQQHTKGELVCKEEDAHNVEPK